MKLSAPIYHLKRKAKLLSRTQEIPLHKALDTIAGDEGYGRWSLLAAKAASLAYPRDLFARLRPGELILVAARPRQGKTMLSMTLALEAMKLGNPSVFFTLEYTENDVLDCLLRIDVDWERFRALLTIDCSDAISSDYLIERLEFAKAGTFIVIDYLHLLDQNREKPELLDQVRALRGFARDRELIVVFISQIDRSYDPAAKPFPDMGDVRLPNPLDLSLFDKTCFLNNGDIHFAAAS